MNKPKGTQDIYLDDQIIREYVEEILTTVAKVNNFSKIETPIFERQEVFVKSVGETSDIVSKEMYSFADRKGRNMVLRPEGTAGVIRAIVENKLFSLPTTLKFFYMGPMFRYERPQKGRRRQFDQFGIEMLSEASPEADVEVILLAKQILEIFKIEHKLVINSLGDKTTRDNYSKGLREYLSDYKDQLTEDSLNRLDKNPLRILDDKVDGKKDFVKKAPRIDEYYSKETKEYFDKVIKLLDDNAVDYEIDTTLVRGLDYYSDTSFEFISTSDQAGSQSTIIGGGRYSNLVSSFGGPDLSGIGFGLGINRLENELDREQIIKARKPEPEVFVLNIDEKNTSLTLSLVSMLRKSGFVTEWNPKTLNFKKAFSYVNKYNPQVLIIPGEKELAKGCVSIKFDGKQEEVKIENIIEHIDGILGGNDENH